MFMLENLKKRINLVESVKSFLNNDKYNCLVFDKDFQRNGVIEHEIIPDYIKIFESCEMAFAGANHGNVMGPLFGLDNVGNEECAILKIYISSYERDDSMKIQNELTMLAIATSIFYPKVKKIKMPVIVQEFNNTECFIKCNNHECLLLLK